jgi:hypothetical protein
MEEEGGEEVGPAESTGWWRLSWLLTTAIAVRFVNDTLRPIPKPFQKGAGIFLEGGYMGVGGV